MLLFWVIEIPLNFEERILGCSIQNTFAVLIVILLAATGESGVYTIYNCGTKVMHTCRYLPQKEKIVKQENNCCL